MKPVLRASKLSATPLVAATVYRRMPLVFSWHYHEQFELVLILDSPGIRHIGDSLEEYRAGDLVLIGPALPHRYASSHEQALADFVVVHFDPALFAAATAADPSLQALTSLLRRCRRGLCFSTKARENVAALVETLADLSTVGRWSQLLQILDQLGQDRDARLLSSATFATGDLRDSDIEPLDRICRYIQKNLARVVTIAEVARVAGMSVSTFTRFFRRATGLSFVEYVNELRLRTAILLLVETDEPVKAVAHKSGYANASYFHRRFVASQGVTPSAYREQRRRSKPT